MQELTQRMPQAYPENFIPMSSRLVRPAGKGACTVDTPVVHGLISIHGCTGWRSPRPASPAVVVHS
jgi:hypothetical protein